MAAGGGLYLTACFATVIILVALVLLGRTEAIFSLKMFATTYEVTGHNVDGMLREVNRILDAEQLTMHSIHIANADPDFRMVFSVDGERRGAESVFHPVAPIECVCQRDLTRKHGTRMNATSSGGQSVAKIPFTKASACGNDFLLVQGEHVSGDLPALTRRLCDRHRGVGADGVEWLFPDTEADVKARLINSDGSEAEISGNGTRCVAAEIFSREGKTEVVVRTGAGLKTCRLTSPQVRQGPTFRV